jgi:hypothetical protein
VDPHQNSVFGQPQGRIMVDVKFILAGSEESNFTKSGEAKQSVKAMQDRTSSTSHKGPMKKLGDVVVDVGKGEKFEEECRHKLVFRLEGSQNREMSQTIQGVESPQFDEKITLPIYTRETQSIPTLIIQDIDPDSQDILSTLQIPLSSLLSSHFYPTKLYSFDHSPKLLQLTFTFLSSESSPKKSKPVISSEETVDIGKKLPTPKTAEFKIDD